MDEYTTDTRETILKEGFEDLMSNGVRAFTVESLAASLGMSKKTIYKFFPSKEKLIFAIMSGMTGRVRKQFEAIIADEPNAALQFVKVMQMITKTLSRVPVNQMRELKIRYPSIWRYVEDFRKERLKNFLTILETGQQQGYIRPDIDTRQVSILYIEIINQIFQPEYFVEHDVSIRDTLDLFISIFSRGIFTPTGMQIIEDTL